METTKCESCTMTPCREACPAGVDVPRYLRYIREGKYDLALAVIRERIPFPAVCGHACLHPCESKCARAQYDEPVAIRMLKRAAEEKGGGLWKEKAVKAAPSGKKVAVLGAGPGGLTAAYYLAGKGHQVTVYDAQPKPGGMMRYGIPEYRLPNSVLDRDIAAISNHGVEIKTNCRVNSLSELKGCHAVFIATGAWESTGIGLEGQGSAVLMDGIGFLQDVNSGKKVSLGKKVVVIGGGNTAIDAARASIRLGAEEVHLVYRRTRDEMPASDEEIREALEEGVAMDFLTSPLMIEGDGIICTKMKLGARDKSGRPTPLPVPGSNFAIRCDTVITAVGQKAATGSLGIATNPDGTVKVNQETLETEVKGVFAAGDCVTGPSSIIKAISQGRLAAQSIDKFLGGDGNICEVLAKGETSCYPPAPMGAGRPATLTISMSERLNGFSLVEKGYDDLSSRREARRCLACDKNDYRVEVDLDACKQCGYCKEVCKQEIFRPADSFNDRGYQPMTATNIHRCVGCQKCFFVCPDFAISIEKVGGAE